MMSSSVATAGVGYTPTAKLLHWLAVALLIGQYVVGWTMPHMGRNTKPETLINLHFSLGVSILLVLLIRLGWRWTHPEPTPIAGLPPWQARSSQAVHHLLYLLLFAIPILGWANASFRGFDVSFFGLFTLPPLMAPRRPGFGWTGDVHALLSNYVLLFVAGLHVAATLYHAFVCKDRVLRRMLP
jgi:cytochrome b561